MELIMFTFRRSLFPSRNELPAPLSGLFPPYFADMVIPVPGADGGINRKAYEAFDAGLFALIDPYPEMAIGDLLEVFRDDKKVRELKVKDEHLNQRWFFFLPKDGLVPGLFTCHYVLTRAGETKPDDPSATLTLLLEIDDPAGVDEEPWDDWHSELKKVGLPQDVIDNGVTKEWADKGVPMTITRYPNIAVGDIILAMWGSVFLLPHELTQAEVEGTAEIIVMARPEDILTAGDSAAMKIQYDVCDLVYNWSVKWSEATSVPVDAGVSRLDALIIKEADDGRIILADLDANPVTLQILIKPNDVFTAGDTLLITVVGTPIPGRPPQTFTVEVIVRNPPYIHEIPVTYEFVKLFAQGTLDASYALRKQDGSPTLYSKRTFATVIGNPSLLPAPTIREVVGNILPALIQAASVVIRYSGIANGDFLTLIWLGKKSNDDDYLHEEEHAVSGEEQKAGEVTIYVMGEHVKALENGSLKLKYRVFNEATGHYGTSESEFLRVNVGSWQATLPAPKVEEAPEDILDPSQTDKLVHVRVLPVNWVKGDTLTFHWIGINLYGSTSGSVPITLATVGQPVRFRVDKQYVSANIGYYVTVIYTLLHAATGKYSYSAPLEVLVGIPLGRLLPPTVVQAPGGILNPMDGRNGVDIDCGYATMDALLDNLGLKWRGSPGAGTSEDLEKPAEATGTVRFHLSRSFVGANINREVAVNYDVQRYGLWTPSEILPLKVLNFQNPETELPRPEVPEAKSGELLVMELTANARVLVKAWPFIALKQLVWLYIEGQASTGDYRIDLLTAHEVNSTQLTQGLNETLLKTELLKLLHGSNATVVCKVIFDNSTDEDAAIVFPKLPLVIRQHYEYVTPVITIVKTALDTVIPEAGQTYDKRLTIEGTATRAEKVDVQINGVPKGMPTVDASSEWTLTVDLIEGLHRVEAIAQYDADDKVSDPRTFTIAVATKPSITAVTDASGPVDDNDTTYFTEVTVSVHADSGQTVQLYEGATAIGSPITLGNNGEGSTKLQNLNTKTYPIKAKATYGDQLESAVRTFKVAEATAPVISEVRDSNGAIQNNGTTFDSRVTIIGTAIPNQRIQIYDGTTPIAPDTLVDDKGIWTKTLTNLNPAGYRILAKGLYGAQPESGVRVLTVLEALAPIISLINDSKGEILPNGTTFDTTVTVTGTASVNQRVQIYDDTTAITPDTPVDGTGEWTKTLTGLRTTTHKIKAKALYGTQPESEVRNFTVAVSTTPRIVSVTDAKGSVGNNGTTYSNEVTVTVSADSNQRVQLYNGAAPIGSPITLGSNGSASIRLSSLSQSTYVLKAKALYGNQLESPAHSFTVRAHLTTTLTSIRHSGGELGNGGKTTDTSVTVTGAATPLYSVQIFLNNVGGQTVPVNGSGVWSLCLGIHLGSNTVYARSVANNQQTESRSFTRENPLAPLNFNTNPVTLGGKTYIIPGSPNVLPAFNSGNSVRHQASGGRPGYTYTSSIEGVAVVDTTGLVTVRGRGTTTITATDAAYQSKSYTVTVTNVIQCFGYGNATWTQANSSVASAGARIPSMAELYEIHAAFGNRWPMGNHHYWSTDPSNFWWPLPARKTFYLNSGGEGAAKTPPWNDYSNVVGIK
ncbi:Ig-like domain-containing protein [Pseudomonas sp. DR 5-09]|nr:Ig-like domain-containing protein [Pseudomonas sp. DR 5-09]